MKPTVYVGFDTSNYTTSAAVCSEEGKILANIRIPLPVGEGERGLRQSDAVFAHVRNLPKACRELREAIKGYTVAAVGCSTRPRSAEDSYMPCFRSGRVAAEAFAAALDLPIYEFSHQDGHIMAALYSADALHLLDCERFAAFHVSGGTTEVVTVTPAEDGFSVEIVGGTKDLHAGQAIDRVGVMMGLKFPCGREIERLASENEGKLPRPKISVKDCYCHFSGLENLARDLWEKSGDKALVSAFVLRFCADTLCALSTQLTETNGSLPIVYAGGVMSNRYLQSRLAEGGNRYFAAPEFSADNAAGIALLCRRRDMSRKGEA